MQWSIASAWGPAKKNEEAFQVTTPKKRRTESKKKVQRWSYDMG